jgi:cell division cycle protein 37
MSLKTITLSWKQRDIHEKREQRRQKLEAFKVEEPMNVSLISRIDSIIGSASSSDISSSSTYLQNEIAKLKSELGYIYEEKKFVSGEQPSENHMIVSLLSQVVKAVKEEEEKAGKTGDEKGRTERIVKTLEWHKTRLLQRQEEIKKERIEIDAEQKKWITSEDIRDGWDSKTVIRSPFHLSRVPLDAILDSFRCVFEPDRILNSDRSAEALQLDCSFVLLSEANDPDRDH